MSVQPDSTVPVNAVEINIDHFSLVAFRQFEVFPVPPHSTGQRTASGSCRVIERKIRLDAPVVRQVQDSPIAVIRIGSGRIGLFFSQGKAPFFVEGYSFTPFFPCGTCSKEQTDQGKYG